MKAFLLFALVCAPAFAQYDQALQKCLEAVNGAGYRGGGMQLSCEGQFVLPSARGPTIPATTPFTPKSNASKN